MKIRTELNKRLTDIVPREPFPYETENAESPRTYSTNERYVVVGHVFGAVKSTTNCAYHFISGRDVYVVSFCSSTVAPFPSRPSPYLGETFEQYTFHTGRHNNNATACNEAARAHLYLDRRRRIATVLI